MTFNILQVYTSLLVISTITVIYTDDLSSSINTFAENFYESIAQDDNVIFSPFTLHAVLSLAYEGSDGKTSISFQNILGLPNIKETALEYKHIFDNLNSVKNITIRIANKIYLQNNYNLKESFKSTAQSYFNADVDTIDFGNGAAATEQINKWVKEKTSRKIDKLLGEDFFTGLTQTVLLDAIYFKGKWLLPFSKSNTKPRKFHVSKTKVILHPMMFMTATLDYADNKELDSKILKMKYQDERFAMTIILPNSKTGINDLEKSLSYIDLNTLTTAKREVDLILPKFKIESTFDLEDPLIKLGIGAIFTSTADFSNMIEGGEGLAIKKVIQKALIEVNEEGTETTAGDAYQTYILATAPKAVFAADHPFIFFITAELGKKPSTASTLLFVGKVASPIY